jgi:hypothetical protein
MAATLRQQLEALEKGLILDSDGQQSECHNFYDWFCRDSSLAGKSRTLFKKVKTFLKHNPQIDIDSHYVFFKNNCPMNGPLYDDFRIVDIETGNVIYTVIPKCSHSGKAEIWGRKEFTSEFGILKQAETFSKLFLENA